MNVAHKVKKPLAGFLIASFLVVGFLSTPTVRAQGLSNAELLAIINELIEAIAILQAQISGTPYVPPVPYEPDPEPVGEDFFPDSVVSGATNDSIELLQRILLTDPAIYPEATVSGYFGALTGSAIGRFQAAFGLPVTSTFTAATETVLNKVLAVAPLQNNPTAYLRSEGVRSTIESAVNDIVLADVVVSGKVVLRTPPQFTVTTKSTDVATIQRIMASDARIYRTRNITGLFDTPTQEAVILLRARYGIPYTRNTDGSINPVELMSSSTVSMFRALLVANASDEVKDDLLLLPEADVDAIVSPTARGIKSVEATRDYRANNTRVLVRYDSRLTDRFEVTATTPNTAVISAIATKLGRPATDFNTKMKYLEINGRDLKDVLFTIKLSDDMSVDVEYLNGTKEFFDIGPEEVDSFVLKTYGGNYEQYQADFVMYRDRARNGEDISEINEIVADFIGASEEEVAAVIRVEVEEYPLGDPCGGGGCG